MRVSFDLLQEGIEFLTYEAELLDNRRFNDWLELMTDDFIYKIPIRQTREKSADTEFSDRAYLMDETKTSLQMRVQRTHTEYDWAEDPASRTRHFLTNFRATKSEINEDELNYKTNFLLFRGKFDSKNTVLLSGERHDTIRKESGEWKLAKRLILLDYSKVPMNNLAIFI